MVNFGIDVLQKNSCRALKGLQVGAIVNPTSIDAHFRHLADVLHASEGCKLAALFGPEHGIRGEAQYMEPVSDVAKDHLTQVPVYSLYGKTFESLTPTAASLKNLDALVFDIQDVGSRYYTYIYTMALCMKAAAQNKIRFVVLDRPNPIGGSLIEGNTVEPGFESFVGLYALPNRHGMTAGEVAQFVNESQNVKAELEIVKLEGWKRNESFEDINRAFVPPSPNMPTVDTARVYPGMCLLEGTNLSEGRGTCRPFEQFGAPFLKSREVAEKLNSMKLPGVIFRPACFTPTFDKHKGVSCEGAFIHVTDKSAFRPLLVGLAVVEAALALNAKQFEWRTHAYEFVDKIPAFDLLCGSAEPRVRLEQGERATDVWNTLELQGRKFLPLRAKHLLYD